MFSTADAARAIGTSKNTLLRWIAEGLIPDVQRDWRGWRVWSDDDIRRANRFRQSYHSRPISRARRRPAPKARYARPSSESMSRYAKGVNVGRRARS